MQNTFSIVHFIIIKFLYYMLHCLLYYYELVGPNCRIGNQTVPEGQSILLDSTTSCECATGGHPGLCQKILTLPPGCMYEGKLYQFGPFKPSPCKHCQCDHSGRAFCAIEDCFFNRCVDAVRKNDTCCPVCLNGIYIFTIKKIEENIICWFINSL